MEQTDPFSARAAVLGVILLAFVGVLGTVWLYVVGHGDQAKDFGITIGAVTAPVAALARITRSVVQPQDTTPDPAIGHQ